MPTNIPFSQRPGFIALPSRVENMTNEAADLMLSGANTVRALRSIAQLGIESLSQHPAPVMEVEHA